MFTGAPKKERPGLFALRIALIARPSLVKKQTAEAADKQQQ
jgi:hypothetical protein